MLFSIAFEPRWQFTRRVFFILNSWWVVVHCALIRYVFFFQHSRWVDVFSQLIRAIEVKIYCWDRVKRVCCHEMYCLFGNNFVAPSLWWEIVLKWFLEYVTTRNNNERMIQKKIFWWLPKYYFASCTFNWIVSINQEFCR